MKNKFFFLFTLLSTSSFAQLSISRAPVLSLTLQCSGGTANRSAVAYNPVKHLYYSVNAGSSSYPLETFDDTGLPVASCNQSFDFRGLWWNSNTNSLEGNGSGTSGIYVLDLDANGIPLGTGTNIITGARLPNVESIGSYDGNDDEILYFDEVADSMYNYNRAADTLLNGVPLTGSPVPAGDLNLYTVSYTGISGKEAAIFDYTNRVLRFFDKTTGAYADSAVLPPSAPNPSAYKAGFANNYLFLFDGVDKIWQGYDVLCFPSGSSMTTSSCSRIIINSQTFDSSGTYTQVLTNAGGCDSTITLHLTITKNDTVVTKNVNVLTANQAGATYQWIDCNNGNAQIQGEINQSFTPTAYGNYAVIITADGCPDTSACISVTNVGLTEQTQSAISFYPNPSNGNITIKFGSGDHDNYTLYITDLEGRTVLRQAVKATGADGIHQISLDNVSRGMYFLLLENATVQMHEVLMVK